MALQTPIVVQTESGIDLTQTYTIGSSTATIPSGNYTPEYPAAPFLVGTKVVATNGSEWIFCQAGATLTIYNALWIDPTFAAVIQAGGSGAPELGAGQIGFLQYVPAGNLSATTIASGTYFWAMVAGEPIVLVASCAEAAPLYTDNSTAGTLTGVTASGGAKVLGMACQVTASGSTASNTLTYATYPTIYR